MRGRSRFLKPLLDSEGDAICANISCGGKLKGFDLAKKSRFCSTCLMRNKLLRWRCHSCGLVLGEPEYNPSRQFCNSCLDKGE